MAGRSFATQVRQPRHGFMWLWASGCCSGVTDDERRARVHAEQAAVSRGGKAHLELVALGTGRKLEPVYVPTGIGYDGITLGGRMAWTPAVPTAAA